MSTDILALAVELSGRGEPFALATVVRCERPTSAKPGAKALILQDGTVKGWVGGACAEPVVAQEARRAMADGQPRLVALVGEEHALPGRTEGLVPYPMTCHSGGTLEIYVEPFLPKPPLVLIGYGPVVDTLAALGRATDFAVTVLAPEVVEQELTQLPLGSQTSVVVATHGNADEDVLVQVLDAGVAYVSLIASRKRAGSVVENLRQRRVPEDHISRLKAPAGLEIGAVTPEEIAVSILAEIVARRHQPRAVTPLTVPVGPAAAPTTARDPVCGMTVTIATARYRSESPTGPVYFCCGGCKQRYDREPGRYAPEPG